MYFYEKMLITGEELIKLANENYLQKKYGKTKFLMIK